MNYAAHFNRIPTIFNCFLYRIMTIIKNRPKNIKIAPEMNFKGSDHPPTSSIITIVPITRRNKLPNMVEMKAIA